MKEFETLFSDVLTSQREAVVEALETKRRMGQCPSRCRKLSCPPPMNAIRELSTKKGFAHPGQRFWERYMCRFFDFDLSRMTL